MKFEKSEILKMTTSKIPTNFEIRNLKFQNRFEPVFRNFKRNEEKENALLRT